MRTRRYSDTNFLMHPVVVFGGDKFAPDNNDRPRRDGFRQRESRHPGSARLRARRE
jgi:ribosomal protein L34